MLQRTERFREYVCKLLTRGDIFDFHFTILNCLTDEVITNIDVFGPLIIDRILSNCESTLVV
jgi:hypothetical protein